MKTIILWWFFSFFFVELEENRGCLDNYMGLLQNTDTDFSITDAI